ncbi:MAG TPA: triose-phosphate isomerase [Candidatus Saccharimonadales bacterium]|jgi:triosephosphate isomerase
MNKSLIVANWKMHLNTEAASLYVHHFNKVLNYHRSVEVVLAPSMLTLQPLSLQIDHRKMRLAAQNAYFKDEGPYTGEVSFTMLSGLVDYALVGHSERRIYFGESLESIRDKVSAAIRNNIKPILCIGESKPDKLAGETKRVIHDQLTTAISNLTVEELKQLTIAYEPVWAISTFDGEPASPADVQKVFDYIRYQIAELYGATAARQVRIIYGGSVNKDDVGGYLALDGCEGALVGADSLNYQDFAEIIDKAYLIQQNKKKS